jgi:hypothetical protein
VEPEGATVDVPVRLVPTITALTGTVQVVGEVRVATPNVVVTVVTAALDGATESIPKPNAATATSEIRLKVVFVDICFLSFSREQEFPALGFG